MDCCNIENSCRSSVCITPSADFALLTSWQILLRICICIWEGMMSWLRSHCLWELFLLSNIAEVCKLGVLQRTPSEACGEHFSLQKEARSKHSDLRCRWFLDVEVTLCPKSLMAQGLAGFPVAFLPRGDEAAPTDVIEDWVMFSTSNGTQVTADGSFDTIAKLWSHNSLYIQWHIG